MADAATRKKIMCRYCGLSEARVTFAPCGHFIACIPCGDKTDECKVCGKVLLASFERDPRDLCANYDKLFFSKATKK